MICFGRDGQQAEPWDFLCFIVPIKFAPVVVTEEMYKAPEL